MAENYFVAMIAVLGTVAGSVVTGFFTRTTAKRSKDFEKQRQRLKTAYHDIAAFHRLEERYLRALESPDKTSESWKREIRRSLADEGYATLSKEATWRECERRLEQLGD